MVFLEKIKGKKKYVLRKRVSTMESRLEGIWDGIENCTSVQFFPIEKITLENLFKNIILHNFL